MNKSNPYRPDEDPKTDIGVLRKSINLIDKQILDLINERLSLAKQIGDLKKQSGIQILDSSREKEILERLLEQNNGPMGAEGLKNIFSAIMAEGRNVQRTD